MKFVRYSKFTGDAADEMDLQDLLKRLGDFFLQSGFDSPYYQISEMDNEQTMEALRQAILRALAEGDLLPEDLLEQLTKANAGEMSEELKALADRLIERMMEEGYLNGQLPQVTDPPEKMPRGGVGAGRDTENTRFEITDKTIDFLGFSTLKDLLDRWARAALAATTRASWLQESNRAAFRGLTNSATH